MTVDVLKSRRESMRWHLLNALDKARPIGALDILLLDIIRCIYADVTNNELHAQLDYLHSHHFVELEKRPDGHWHAKLNHNGIDVVEYTIDCPVGIARPAKYWA